MSGFMEWKYISEAQVIQLEQSDNANAVKKLLEDIFKLHQYNVKKSIILRNFHFFNYAFCKEKALSVRKISTFMSIMNEVLLKDCTVSSPKRSMNSRFDYFQELLIKHSVQRPPQSVQIFLPSEIEPIMEYAMESYFRKFRLYQYIFDTLFVVNIKQIDTNGVEVPKVPLSLCDGYQLTEPVVKTEETTADVVIQE